jgi:polysaccharide biosynthesis transport protein
MSEKTDEWQDGEEVDPGFSFGDILEIVRRRAKLLFCVVFGIVAATVVASFLLPNQYEATTTVQLSPRATKIVEINSVIEDLKGDTPTIESEVEIVRSAAVLNRVIDILGLRSDSEFNQPSAFVTVLRKLGLARKSAVVGRLTATGQKSKLDYLDEGIPPGTIDPWQDDVIAELATRLKVYRVRNTLLINISFRSKDPVKAARISNAIAEVYIRAQLTSKQRANMRATKLLDIRVEGLRNKLADAEQRLERFKATHDIFDSEGHLLVEKQLAREMEAIVLARDKTAKTRAKYDQSRRLMLEGGGRESVADVLENQTIRLLRDGLTKALRRQAELQTRYGPRHPAIEQVAADVAKAQNTLTAEVNKIIKNLHSEYIVARERQQQLEKHLGTLKATITSHKSVEANFRELQREVTATRKLYESLLSRTKQVSETTSLQFADSRLVQRASVPQSPSSPKRAKLVLLAFAGSLALGAALVFLLEFAQPGFVRQAEIEHALDLPQIATFPELPNAEFAGKLRPVRLMLAAPTSAFAEATRALRHELDDCRPGVGPRIILVASALPNEGRSLVASNLAHYMALTGCRTLLIDGDLRRGKLSVALGLANQPGLLDVLAGRIAPAAPILIDKTTGLHVLPAHSGRIDTSSAPELLSSHALHRTFDELKHHFDTIVVDAPPVLPVADARLMAAHVDQIAFVTTWRRTPKEIVRRSIRLLGRNQSKIAGIVVNRIDPQRLHDISGLGLDTSFDHPSALRKVA